MKDEYRKLIESVAAQYRENAQRFIQAGLGETQNAA